ncbi:MAG: hypothetical protein U5L45_11095 [Saprospiraceae bacterium]|nr:hypothetical protein [Saprospiraceae bacterium]
MNNLRVGDKVMRGKGLLSDDCGIYIGSFSGKHIVAANKWTFGICYLSFDEFLGQNTLKQIAHFQGTEQQRRQIRPFIDGIINTKYDLSTYNSEYFITETQSNTIHNPALMYRAVIMGVLEHVWFRSMDLQS